jgi:very-short-patch-repair endonuclease
MNKRIIDRHMFYGAKRNIFLRAIELRNTMTEAEKNLWEELKKKEIFNARWKRQHPIDIFVVDFYCHKHKLAIEVDGEIHLKEEIREHDDGRSHDIEKLGIKILRFTNKEIFDNIEFVRNRILKEINSVRPL